LSADGNRRARSLGVSFHEGRAAAFLLYELGSAVRSEKLLPSLREWLDETFEQSFEDNFIADFVVENTQDLMRGKGSFDDTSQFNHTPVSASDLAILQGESENDLAPPGDIRCKVAPRSEIYTRILSLVSSQDVMEREILPVQLCPQFSLLATLKDSSYGGNGILDLDGVLEAPLILPTSECSGIEFTDLTPSKQWVVTSSYYFVSENGWHLTTNSHPYSTHTRASFCFRRLVGYESSLMLSFTPLQLMHCPIDPQLLPLQYQHRDLTSI
jgi:hypothetical protein